MSEQKKSKVPDTLVILAVAVSYVMSGGRVTVALAVVVLYGLMKKEAGKKASFKITSGARN